MSNELQPPQKSEEVDLGELFKAIGNVFYGLGRFIYSVFYKFFLVFVWWVFFIKKHVVKIAIAGVLGFGYGVLKYHKDMPIYRSTTIIKQNYKTGENLYRLIDNYNELISEGDSIHIAGVLGVKPAVAASIISFDVESVVTEEEKLLSFNKYIKSFDSIPDINITYENFIDNAFGFQYPKQRIIIKAKQNNIFTPLINSTITKISETAYFVTEQKKDLEALERLEKAILESLEASKQLQNVYKDVLVTPLENNKGSQTTIRIDNTEDKSKTKEFELYNSDMELRRELVEIQREKDDLKNIIEIISSQENQGTIYNTKDFFSIDIDSKLYYTIIFVFLAIAILFSSHFIKFLERYKEKV